MGIVVAGDVEQKVFNGDLIEEPRGNRGHRRGNQGRFRENRRVTVEVQRWVMVVVVMEVVGWVVLGSDVRVL